MAGARIHHVYSSLGRETEENFESEVVIGRREHPGDSVVGLDLPLDRAVSRRHARI